MIAWFHCYAGIAGDMALGALFDAGADAAEVTGMLRRLPVEGWSLETETVTRAGVRCTRAVVAVRDDDPHTARAHRDLAEAVRAASLPRRVEARALATFDVLARAEGALHGVDPADVHFHEVGGHDALVDVVGTAAALEVLGVDEVVCSPVALGTGTVRTRHGVLANPAPAVLRILEGAPVYGRPVPVELTTPTGAALVRALSSSFGPMPPMTVTASGYGAGSADIDALANCTQVVIGRPVIQAVGAGQPVTVLEANLDDATGEQLASALRAALEAGAHDAWVTPNVMKKGRPGHTVHVLCDPARAEGLAALVREQTGTFGVRAIAATRWAAARDQREVEVEGLAVRMKVGPHRAKPEHDDVVAVSEATGLGAHEVASRAEEALRRGGPSPGGASGRS